MCDKSELEGASKPALLLTGEGDSDDDEGAIDKPCCISPGVVCATTVLLTVFAVWHCVCFDVVRIDTVWCASRYCGCHRWYREPHIVGDPPSWQVSEAPCIIIRIGTKKSIIAFTNSELHTSLTDYICFR